MPKPENGARKRILLVEDDADLRDLIAGRLTRAGYECAGAADGTEALAYITDNRPDALLLDQKLPDMTGRQLLENLAELGLGVPFMVMTGQGDERLAVEMMKLGAADYLLKDTDFLDILPLAVDKLFRLADMERELQETRNNLMKSEELHRKLLTTVPDLIMQTDLNGHITFVNEHSFSKLKYVPRETLHGRDMLSFIAEKDLSRARENTGKMFHHALGPQEYQLCFEDGTTLDAEVNGDVIYDAQNKPTGMVYVIRDITERKRVEEALREERERLEHILSITGTGIDIVDGDFNLHFVDKGWQKIYGDPTGRKCYEYFNGLNEPCPGCGIPIALETRQVTVTEEVLPRENNRIVEVHIIPFQNAEGKWLVAEFNVDITQRKRAEAEKDKLQAQLIQAQKMESVGRLAGGVAHDFNNMLGVILGQAELAMLKLGPNDPIGKGLVEIQKAASHSADLVKQLLAFARKQTISPRPLNLNDTVEGMLNMIRRLIGEDIDLLWKPGRDLWPVEIDPVQVDQVLANLCVNARDAISGVGKITIETERVVFNHDYCSRHPGFVPGEFVLLAVSDNGCGMDSDTLAHLFEPFFTTKEVGRGTGLGLASVYGAVKQNQGFINVYSEPGRGSTFKIYLPRHLDQAALIQEKRQQPAAERGSETILLVEDEPMILDVIKTMLEMLGYNVLAAGTPGEALRLAREYKGWIHLLMTDVVMPEMNGRDLAGKMLSLYPDIKRLFMSGYTANVIAHHGVLEEGVYFIQKPFSLDSLGAKIGEALERK